MVVTRPQPQADATAQRLRAMGHEAVVLPLTKIVPLSPATPDIASFHSVVATSANALRHAAPELLRALSPLPLMVVGDRTADVATELGFSDVTSAAGNVDALINLATAHIQPGAVILYLCGKPRRPDFETGMKLANRQVVVAETYAAEPLEVGRAETAKISGADAVLLYSQATSDRWAMLGAETPQTAMICISQRVANVLDGKRRIVVAAEPTEKAMLAALDRV